MRRVESSSVPLLCRFWSVRTVLAVVCLLALLALVSRETAVEPLRAKAATQARQAFARLPLSFTANRGQADQEVKFTAGGAGYNIALTASGASLSLRNRPHAPLRINLAGANPRALIAGVDSLPGKINYLRGNDPSGWLTDVPTFARVEYQEIYPGVDAVFYGNQQQLEYDFVVAPGADASRIRLSFAGAEAVRVDESGDLLLRLDGGEIRQHKPIVYQAIDGRRREIPARYDFDGANEARFALGDYDRDRELVIDPVLSYAGYLGGSGEDQAAGIAVDGSGNIYVAGSTASTDFATANAYAASSSGSTDLFVTKMAVDANGNATLLFSTYLGGRDEDRGNGVAVDGVGNVYVVGSTTSTNFPATNQFLNAFGSSAVFKSVNSAGVWSPRGSGLSALAVNALAIQPDNAETVYAGTAGGGVYRTQDGGANWQAANGDVAAAAPKLLGSNDVRALAIAPGKLYAGTSRGVFNTTDGGATWHAPELQLTTDPVIRAVNQARENVRAMALDPANAAIVYTGVVGGIFKSTDSGLTSALINTGLPTLDATTGLSSVTMQALAVAGSTTIYAGGTEGVFKTTNGGGVWAAKNNGLTDLKIAALAVDAAHANIVYAGTPSGVFKSVDGGETWAASNTGLTSTQVRALSIDGGSLYAVTAGGVFKSVDAAVNWTAANSGQSNSDPRSLAAKGATLYLGASGAGDAVLVKLSPAGALLASGYLAGGANENGNGVAVDANGNAFVTGATNSANFLFQSGAAKPLGGASDVFVAKINFSAPNTNNPLIYSALIGGSDNDQGNAIAVDGSGNAYVTGGTFSPNFPVSEKAWQKTYGNLAAGPDEKVAAGDAFVFQLNAAGNQTLYATYLGGKDGDVGKAIALGAGNSIYLTGVTASGNFAVTDKAFGQTLGGKTDAFVTALGAISTSGEASLTYSTFLGGAEAEQGTGIAVNSGGQAIVTGGTGSANFPVVDAIQPIFNGVSDAFAALIDVTSGELKSSTFLGGSGSDTGLAVAVDSGGAVYLAGVTGSANFPLSLNAADKVCCASATGRDNSDGFIAKIIAGQSADLSITKEAAGNFRVGGKATYTITVRNVGPGAAQPPLRVIDQLPAELTFDSFAGADWNCAASGQIVTCLSTKSLAANAVSSLTLTVNVVAVPKPAQAGDAPPPLVNTASVAGFTSDATAGDNQAGSAGNLVDPPCSFAIAPANQEFQAAGGTGSVGVTTQNGCAWTAEAASGANFLTIEGAGGASGSGAITFRVAANTGLNDRSGSLLIAGQTFTVTQRGQGCVYVVAPESQAFDSNGGNGGVTIATAAGCPWQVVSDAPSFISLLSVASGDGNGTVSYNVTANSDLATRAGTLTVLGRNFSKTIAILQGSKTEAVCAFRLLPSSADFAAKGGDSAFYVEVSPDSCEWAATSGAAFISVTSDRDQSGSAFITYLIPPNTGDAARQGAINIAQRIGTVTAQRQTFTVTQANQTPPPVVGCKYTLAIAPSSQTFDANGGDGTAMVGAANGCAWQASVSAGNDFVTIQSGASGAGSGAVKFNVATNPNSFAREATLTIAGQTIFLRQSGRQTGSACALSVSPAGASFTAKGGDRAFFVNSSLDTCEWVATSDSAFVKVTGDPHQSGSAYVTFVVESNASASRNAVITISEKTGGTTVPRATFSVAQAGAAAPRARRR